MKAKAMPDDLPSFQAMMLPILEVAAGGEATTPSCVERIALRYKLSGEQLARLQPSGSQTVVYNRAAWAKFHLEKAGLIARVRRGAFTLTERGRQVLDRKPDEVGIRLLSEFPEYRAIRKRDASATAGDGDPTSTSGPGTADPGSAEAGDAEARTPSERIEDDLQEIEAALREELLDRVVAGTPAFFETLVVRLLVAMGYGDSVKEAGQQLGGPGDGGVDGVIRQDALGLEKIYVQAKRYQRDRRVAPEEVRAFSGSLDDKKTTRGVFITTASFSAKARSYVEGIQKQIVLIDGDRLAELMIRHNVGVRQERTVEIKRVDEVFFEG